MCAVLIIGQIALHRTHISKSSIIASVWYLIVVQYSDSRGQKGIGEIHIHQR